MEAKYANEYPEIKKNLKKLEKNQKKIKKNFKFFFFFLKYFFFTLCSPFLFFLVKLGQIQSVKLLYFR
jgi:hypothetical protein